MNKTRYPFILSMPSPIHQHASIPRGSKYAGVMIILSFVVFWLLSGSFKYGGIAAFVTSIFYGFVLAPHALAKSQNKFVKVTATLVVGFFSLAGFFAAIMLAYILVFVRPGTGAASYYLSFLMLCLIPTFFWFSFAYAYQIHHHWKHAPNK